MKLACECAVCKAVYEFVAFLARLGEELDTRDRCDVCRRHRCYESRHGELSAPFLSSPSSVPDGDFEIATESLWWKWKLDFDSYLGEGGRQVDRRQWSALDQYTRYRESELREETSPAAKPSPKRTLLDEELDARKAGRHVLSPGCFADRAEAASLLCELERWQNLTINGKGFRCVAGGPPDEPMHQKLFFTTRPPGLPSLMMLEEARSYALDSDFVKSPKAKDFGWYDVPLSALGQVYSSLLIHEGVIAKEDCIEVTSLGDKPTTWFEPVSRLSEFPEKNVVRNADGSLRILKAGDFALRTGHNRKEKFASYYTPDVLAECLARYTLKERLEGISADEILELSICDPALGANAIFIVHAIEQLAHAYLERKQRELGEFIPSPIFRLMFRRAKKRIARNVYGVDLDPGAVMVAEMIIKVAVAA
jgi:hypothetical protein